VATEGDDLESMDKMACCAVHGRGLRDDPQERPGRALWAA